MEIDDDIDDDQLIMCIESHLKEDNLEKACENQNHGNDNQFVDVVEKDLVQPSCSKNYSTKKGKAVPKPKKRKIQTVLSKEEIIKAIEEIDEVMTILQGKMSKLLEAEYDLLMYKYDHIVDIKPSASTERAKKSENLISLFHCAFRSPYFKDRDFFWAPLNADSRTIRKVNKDLHSQPWSQFYVEKLEESVRKLIVKAYVSTVKRKHSDSQSITFNTKLDTLKNINYFKKEPLKTFLNEGMESNIDWFLVSYYLGRKYSAPECEKMWKLYSSPNINKGVWTKSEIDKLKSIDISSKSWDEIASLIESGRSGYQCFLYYVNHLRKLEFTPWTEQEMDFLREVVSKCTYGSKIRWPQVNFFFENRTFKQIYEKYVHSLDPKIKMGHFGVREDKLLLMLQHKFDLSIKQLSQIIKHRTAKQIKSRIEHSLNPDENIKFGEWTVEEDELLVRLVDEIGQDWAKIAKKFNSRNRVQVRHRYNRLKQILDSGRQIKDIKRTKRQHRRIHKLKAFTNKLKSLKHKSKPKDLKKVINAINEKYAIKRQETPIDLMDKELIAFFMPKMNISNFNGEFSDVDLLEEVEQISRVLKPKLNRKSFENLRVSDSNKPDLAAFFENPDVMELMLKMNNEVQSKKTLNLLPPNKNTFQALTSLLLPVRISENLKTQQVFTDTLKEKNHNKKISEILGIEEISPESVSCPVMSNENAVQTILETSNTFMSRLASIFVWSGLSSTNMEESSY